MSHFPDTGGLGHPGVCLVIFYIPPVSLPMVISHLLSYRNIESYTIPLYGPVSLPLQSPSSAITSSLLHLISSTYITVMCVEPPVPYAVGPVGSKLL